VFTRQADRVTTRGFLVWWTRVMWAAVALVAPPAWGDALATHSTPVRVTAGVVGWTAWGLGLVALVALSTATLTIGRLVLTMAVPAQIVVAVHEPGGWPVLAVAASVAAAVGVMSAEFAQASIQASAYGAEERFPLRLPTPFIAPIVLAWLVLTTLWLIGPLTLAARSWWVGVPTSAAAVGLSVVLGRRFHRLTRRWLVLVPAGIVLHDHLLLAETVLLKRNDLRGVQLACGGPDPIDLTGLTWGAAVQVDLVQPQVVIPRLAGSDPRAMRPASVRTIVIAPSRPGQLLSAARLARLA
jgi:hypothetical protein